MPGNLGWVEGQQGASAYRSTVSEADKETHTNMCDYMQNPHIVVILHVTRVLLETRAQRSNTPNAIRAAS